MQQDPQPQKVKKVLVAAGGNAASAAGDAFATVQAGLKALTVPFGDVDVSHFYQTPAFPAGSGPDFVNAVAAFHSDLTPEDILATLFAIETTYGRIRADRWGQRTLDLDLIACGDDILPDLKGFSHWKDLPLAAQKVQTPSDLILPHPRLQDRPFVLVPLTDIAPDWVHPVLGVTITQMIDAFAPEELAEIMRI